ncbi:MAG: enoyl-CoA hydratase/isomerase [Caulobacter sp.]|nr:enoyl-CoA hydratase/isomerase [Caulobacter sp.]
MAEFVSFEVCQGVAVITLNRPDRLNAIGREMGAQYDAIITRVGPDPAVRAIVLTGAGRAFCAGADLERLDELAETKGAALNAPLPGQSDPIYDVFTDAPVEIRARYLSPMACPQPVIAAVNGACAGLGLVLATACDIRFAASTALFAASFSRRGLVAETGLAYTLPRLVGEGAAADILLSGRKVGAEEAGRIGLVNAILEPELLLEHALAYARELAEEVSPRSARIIKRQLRLARSQSFRESVDAARAEVLQALASDDFIEGLNAFKGKRPPAFTGD